MATIDILTGLIQMKDGVILASDATRAGVSRTTLSKLVNEGLLERIARGQYVLPNTLPDELYLWQQRVSQIVYSHETALFLHGMAERTPARNSVTIPSTAKLSPAFPADYKVYYIKPELQNWGVVEVPSKMGHIVRAYDVERTICDILRSRSRIDDQTVIAAMKNYAARKNQDMNRLRQYAEVFRVTKLLRQYLEVLL